MKMSNMATWRLKVVPRTEDIRKQRGRDNEDGEASAVFGLLFLKAERGPSLHLPSPW